MRLLSLLPALVACAGSAAAEPVTGKEGNATVVENNPVGKVAIAKLPAEPFFKTGSLNGNVEGSITIASNDNGIGLVYTVKLSNLPKEGGPFPYHIHDKRVPEDGNCTATAAHLDPFLRGEDPVCDPEFPQTCQVGDLSGKYKKITSDPFEIKYHDDFGSMNVGNGASIPDRSIVIHFANKTRITCANFEVVGTVTVPTASPTGGMNMTPIASQPPFVTPGAGMKHAFGIVQVVLVASLAAVFVL
jgi:hypothetical protein